MKIQCPQCGAAGSLPDHEIPEAGRFISCPRCHHGFTVIKPRSGGDSYQVDTCPSCSYSTFGDETFGTCPKCGVVVKSYIERQREEQRLQHNQELLTKTYTAADTAPPPEPETTPVADFLDRLHPVNLIGWGLAATAAVILASGLWGLIGYHSAEIQARLTEQREEQVSGWYVFLHFGLMHWVRIVYGLLAVAASTLFIKRMRVSLRPLAWLIWAGMGYVLLSYCVSFVSWAVAPIPHTIGGYLIELLNVIVMSALFGVPLFLLERYLRERAITTIVRL